MSFSRLYQRHTAVHRQWIARSQNDPDFGGAKFGTNLALAKQTVDKYGTAGLKQALEKTGFGSHPELIRFVVKVGRALAGTQAAAKPKKSIGELF